MSDVKLVLVCFICTTFIVGSFFIFAVEYTREARNADLVKLAARIKKLDTEVSELLLETNRLIDKTGAGK